MRRWRWNEPVAPLAALLARGGVLALPTESSYGLGVDPGNRAAVEAVYRIKERERGKALPVVVGSWEQLRALGLDPEAREAAPFVALGPAPVSVLLPLTHPLPAAAGSRELAVRLPDHQRLRELLLALGPLTATSANLSGSAPLLDPAAAEALLAGSDGAVVDDGILPGGVPSTLVRWRQGELEVVRPGRWSGPRIEAALAGSARLAASRSTTR